MRLETVVKRWMLKYICPGHLALNVRSNKSCQGCYTSLSSLAQASDCLLWSISFTSLCRARGLSHKNAHNKSWSDLNGGSLCQEICRDSRLLRSWWKISLKQSSWSLPKVTGVTGCFKVGTLYNVLCVLFQSARSSFIFWWNLPQSLPRWMALRS